MKTNIRLRLLRWVNRRIFKTPPNQIPPKFIRGLYAVLFPLRALYERQSRCHYDFVTDTYTIGGVKISGRVFNYFDSYAKGRNVFRFIKSPLGDITIEDLTKYLI